MFTQLDERDEEVESILREFLETPESSGYESACRYADSASAYKVLYTSRSLEETSRSIQQMIAVGLGENELSDNLIERRGDTLIIGFDQNISYFAYDSF